MKNQIDGNKREDSQVVLLLGLLISTDTLESCTVLDEAKGETDNDELEAEYGDPPPVEGEVEVEAGIVVTNGGHHRDLEEEKEDEEAEEQAAPVRDTGEEDGGGTQGLQLQVMREHEDTHDLVTHAEVPVQHVQECRVQTSHTLPSRCSVMVQLVIRDNAKEESSSVISDMWRENFRISSTTLWREKE